MTSNAMLSAWLLSFSSFANLTISTEQREKLRQAATRIETLSKENDKLRASLANGREPCVYCHLSREDWPKCEKGFPGCSRADDAMLCPHVGMELKAQEEIISLRRQLDVLNKSDGEPIAWESTTLGYIRFVTDSRYRKFNPRVQAWYKPYRCSNCEDKT